MFGHRVKQPAVGVLLLVLSQAETTLCQQTPAPLDCSGSKPSDGTVYQSSQHSYDILCSTDYAGNDIASSPAATFEECIALCDTTPGCIDVSWGNPTCWMKSKIDTPATRDGIWTARRNDLPPPVSCEEPGVDGTVYTASGGAEFRILCGKNYAGGDMGVVHSGTFTGCMDACEQTAGCVDVSYVGEACYLKNTLNALEDAGHVWTGVRLDALSPSSTSTSTASPSPTALSCVNNASDGVVHTTPSGAIYDIICGQEYAGGDLRGVGADTFEACLAACDDESACVDVSYVSGACYMKQTLNGPLIHAAYVWTAIRRTSTGGGSDSDPAIPDLACVDGQPSHEIFTTSNNRQYQVFCGVDFAGGDMSVLTALTFSGCIQACEGTAGCVTVAYSGTTCWLKNRLRPRVDRGHIWSALYLGPPPPAQSSSSSASSTETTSAIQSSTVVPTSTRPDSNPIRTENVWIPEFDDTWTSTYTWNEVALPTFTDAHATPIPFPPVEKDCFIDPEAGTEFHLISPDTGYIIEKNGGPGFLSQPETEEEGLALLAEIADWKPPSFVFESPAGAPQGVYDIVYMSAAGKRYFALAASGEMSFVASSTGTETTNGLATTVFGVTCGGYLTVTVGGVMASLKATIEGETVLDGDGEPSEDGIRVLPKDLLPVNPNSIEAANQAATTTSRMRRRAWDGMGQDGYAPRCPNTPRTVWPRVKNGAGENNPSGGCGSANGADFPFGWNFDECCNGHDKCFGDCATGTFEQCNYDFWGCMTRACVRDYSGWHNSWMQPTCIGVGTFYYTAVSSSAGKEIFEAVTQERCECYCREPNTALCGGNTCLNVFRNNANCGGCDRACPRGTRCTGLSCACSRHQCGNTCLDLETHPRNCGQCGNVCASGFCYQGKCAEYLPASPDRCYPREGFENGDFARHIVINNMWREEASPYMSRENDVLYVEPSAGTAGGYSILMRFPEDSNEYWASLSQDVHVCAGQDYEVNFLARWWQGSDGACQIRVQLGDRTLQDWTALRVTAGDWAPMGPFRLAPFELGQTGVWQGPRHYLKATFTVTVMCRSQIRRSNRVYLDSFSIAPV